MTNNEPVNSFMTLTKFEDLKQTNPESLLLGNKKRNKLKNNKNSINNNSNNNNNNNKVKYSPYKETCLYDERKESTTADLIKITTTTTTTPSSNLSGTHQIYDFIENRNYTEEPSLIPCFIPSIHPKHEQEQAVIISADHLPLHQFRCKEFTQIPRLVTMTACESTAKHVNYNNTNNNNNNKRKGLDVIDLRDLPSPLEDDDTTIPDILFPRGKESKDETVRLASAAADRKASRQLVEAEFNDAFHSNKYNNMNKPETPISPTPHIYPSTTTTASSEDEFESLDVPLWSDAYKTHNNNNNNHNNHNNNNHHDPIKRKSVASIDDSSWGDTESSSITSSSRIPNSINWLPPPLSSSSTSSTTALSRERSSKNILKMIHQIQADRLVKRELVGQLEKSEVQYTKMRVNYESRLEQLKQHLFKIEKKQDHLAIANKKKRAPITAPTVAAAARSNAVLNPDSRLYSNQLNQQNVAASQLRQDKQAQEIRSQYEVKLKQLTNENQELRKKYGHMIQSLQTDRTKAEEKVRRLSADVEQLQLDKKKLNKIIKQQTDKAREAFNRFQRQIEQLKRRESKAVEAKDKLQQVNQQQSELLKKRTEETAAANSELRQLKATLRRSAIEGVLLNQVSLDKIIAGKIPRKLPS